MPRAISIATASHLRLARRLAISLAKSNPGWTLTLYCEDEQSAQRVLGVGPWVCVDLPSIASVGAKRAKFDAYQHAIKEGSFVWLDADIIVLDRLDELADFSLGAIIACLDDLTECSFIADRMHPWPGDCHLSNQVYFNSGVFAAPVDLGPFLERCAAEARNDEQWKAWTIDTRLLDNHFLCAMVNRDGISVHMLDPREFNWQGLHRAGQLTARAVEGRLVNVETALPLRLAHFAGIQDVDNWLRFLPASVLGVFARAVSTGEEDLLAALGAAFPVGSIPEPDTPISVAYSFAKPNWLPAGVDSAPPGDAISSARSLVSYARSLGTSCASWNGLRCGGPYLEPAEYAFLRSVVRDFQVKTVLETGAGYTSVLFRRENVRVVSIEAQEGPWAQLAREAGSTVTIVPYDCASGTFDDALLRAVIEEPGNANIDLILIDSPVGTVSRLHSLRQLLQYARSRLIAFHDAHRDGEVVFAAAHEAALQVLAYLPSWRGIAVLGPPDAARRVLVRAALNITPTVDIQVIQFNQQSAQLRITNCGPGTLDATGEDEWLLSYHLETDDPSEAQWDNVRMALPCSLESGDALEMPVVLPRGRSGAACWFDLVQEGREWLSSSMPTLSKRRIRLV